jgi:predicted house-cleaning noncanonical NTP pyrophosphatase (MazG superfamily)
MKEFHKLVRDGIPDIIRANGDTPHYHIIEDDDEYLAALFAKDVEEGIELAADPNLGELADKLEVIYAIGRAKGFTPAQIEEARAKKAAERGVFEKRIFLETTD